jgi:hypothetical protein
MFEAIIRDLLLIGCLFSLLLDPEDGDSVVFRNADKLLRLLFISYMRCGA